MRKSDLSLPWTALWRTPLIRRRIDHSWISWCPAHGFQWRFRNLEITITSVYVCVVACIDVLVCECVSRRMRTPPACKLNAAITAGDEYMAHYCSLYVWFRLCLSAHRMEWGPIEMEREWCLDLGLQDALNIAAHVIDVSAAAAAARNRFRWV